MSKNRVLMASTHLTSGDRDDSSSASRTYSGQFSNNAASKDRRRPGGDVEAGGGSLYYTDEMTTVRSGAFGLVFMLCVTLISSGGLVVGIVAVATAPGVILLSLSGLALCWVMFVAPFGFFNVKPNEMVVLTICGRYIGTVRTPGLCYVFNVFIHRHAVDTKLCSLETDTIKINDVRGNPIHIGGVVVWRVVDAAAATLNIQRCNKFVASQSEAAFRLLASRYPYDSYNGEMSLLGHTEEIGNELREQIVARLHGAGVEILESTLTHLSYAPEICQAMLQRQQASAVVAARREIVNGAVSMCDDAMAQITDAGLCTFNDRQKAETIANLLIVLCSDSQVVPTLPLSARGGK